MTSDFLAHFIQIVPIGLVSGMMSGAFGIGGGIIIVPLLRHLLGLTAQVAVGNSLGVILPTACIGALNYLKKGKLIFSLSFACGIPAVIGTAISSAESNHFRGQHLMLFLAGLMILVGIDFISGFSIKLKASGDSNNSDNNQGNSKPENDQEEFKLDSSKLIICALLGLLAGIMSGLLGIGGGFLLVPSFCYFLSLPLKVAFGTSLVVVALVALPGTVIHSLQSHVQLSVVLPMLAGSIPGAWLGSYFALKARDRSLRIVFGVLLLLLSVIFAARELSIQAPI